MKLSASTKIHDLLKSYPFLEDFLASYNSKFEMLKNRMARATIGRVATLRTAAGIASIELRPFLEAIAAEIEKHTKEKPEMDTTEALPSHTREERLTMLKTIIRDLHDGGDIVKARQQFVEAVEDVEASEIAAMEEDLIKGGLPVSEVQRLCDVHVGAFRSALDEHDDVQVPPGHPIHTYIAANKIITALANELGTIVQQLGSNQDVDGNLNRGVLVIEKLEGIENHYQRKENQLFPFLERHNITGPSKVMWGVHDQIRAQFKTIRNAAHTKDVKKLIEATPAFVRDLVEMVYKEEKILFPMSHQMLSEKEWVEIRQGEDELDYVLAKPAAMWPEAVTSPSGINSSMTGALKLLTGELSLDQLNLILTNLPMDLSFVDEQDTVRFYSEGPDRIFPRSPAVIGRKVQNCHPPKSVHMVQEILDSFRAGKQNVAEFWIQIQSKFIHIRYFAIHDKTGVYRGCLEVSQDVTGIRKLQGERRLLEWTNAE